MRFRRLIPLTCAAAVLVPGGPIASAQVVVDPGSPSGKEYAIPLEQARREATGNNSGELNATEQGSRTAPLFGEGIGDGGDTGDGGAAASGSGGGNGGSGDSGTGGGDKPQGATKGQQDAARSQGAGTGSGVSKVLDQTNAVSAAVPADGSGSSLTVIALAVSVLVLGAVLGSIFRRRSNTG